MPRCSGPAVRKRFGCRKFRFEGEEVRIRRHGNAVILEPITNDWAWLAGVTGPIDEDFELAANEEPAAQNRPALDFFE